MRHRHLLRVGGVVLLGGVVILAGRGSLEIGPSPDDPRPTQHTTTGQSSRDAASTMLGSPAQTTTSPLPESVTDSPTADTRIPCTAVAVEFGYSNQFGIFRVTAVDGPITHTGHVAVLALAHDQSLIALDRLAEANTERNVITFINRTTFAHEALVVFSRRFGSYAGENRIPRSGNRIARTT